MATETTRPPRGYLAVLFVVSASMLAFEVLLVRLFEFSHWHHFAGLTVSLALLGLGAAGTCLAVWGNRSGLNGDGPLLVGTAIQATGTLAVLFLHSQVALRPLFAAWDQRELARLLLVDFAAFVPFFGAGLVIGQVFRRWPAGSGSIYAANLLGSGTGSLIAGVSLAALSVERILALVALLPALVLLIFAFGRGPRRAVAVGAILGVVGAAVLIRPPAPMVSDFKTLSRIMDLPDARRLSTQTGLPGTLTLVRSDSLRVAPGLSLKWSEPVPTVDAAIVGSDRLIPMPRRFDVGAEYTKAGLSGLPFQLRPAGKTLILGTSTWQSPLAAAKREIVWVEPDERVLNLAHRRGLSRTGTVLTTDSIYRFVATTEQRFELIVVDAAFAGGDAATENYLMTIEGLAAALSRLNPRGLLVVPFKLSVPPRQTSRALATVRGALRRLGSEQPGRHTVVLRGLQEMVLMASPAPLAAGDLEEVRRFAENWRFDLVWLPDIGEAETNRYHRLDAPVFHDIARAVFEDRRWPESARWFEKAPAEFRRPYFWRSLNWERIPDFVRSMGHKRALSYLDWTLILTAVSAGLATLLAFVLTVAPLGWLPAASGAYSRTSIAMYFSALGLGYILIELVILQRTILFLGEPVISAALVFTVFLVGSGFGSAHAPQSATSKDTARIFGSIAAGLAVSVLSLWPLAGDILELSWVARTAVIAMTLAPLAWAMGRAFPWALRQLTGYGRWVPWAWSINGFASVVAASLATLISVQWGQPVTVTIGMVCYLTAYLIARRWVAAAG